MDPFYRGLHYQHFCFLWTPPLHPSVRIRVRERSEREVEEMQEVAGGDIAEAPCLNASQPFTASCRIQNPAQRIEPSATGRIGKLCPASKKGQSSNNHTPLRSASLWSELRHSDTTAAKNRQLEFPNLQIAPLTIHPCCVDVLPACPSISDNGNQADVELDAMTWGEAASTVACSYNGNYYTLRNKRLKGLIQRALQHRAQHCDEISEAQNVFNFYLARGIPDASIASFPEDLRNGIRARNSRTDRNPDDGDEEIEGLFKFAVKLSMLEYAMLCPLTRKRFGLDALAPLLAVWQIDRDAFRAPLFRKIPKEWRSRFAANRISLSKNLHRVDPVSMTLRTVWVSSFQSRLLLTTGEELEKLLPLDLKEFKQIQTQTCEKRKGHLLTSWASRAADLLRGGKSQVESHHPQGYLRSLDALQRLQLKTLLHESVLALKGSFFRFGSPVALGDIGGPPDQVAMPVFVLQISCEGGKVTVKPSLQEFKDTIRGLLAKCIGAISEVPTIQSLSCAGAEQKDADVQSRQGTDWVVQETKETITLVLEQNFRASDHVRYLFAKHAECLMDPELISTAKKAIELSVPDMESKLDKIRQQCDEAQGLCRTEIPAGLFMISTQLIKKQLIDRTHEIRTMLLEKTKSKTEAQCAELIEEFEEKAAVIEKDVKTLTEAVQMRDHICETQELVRAKKRTVQEIEEKHRFLVKYRCKISDWILDSLVQTYHWPSKLSGIMDASMTRTANFIKASEGPLKEKISVLKERVEEMTSGVGEIEHEGATKRKDRFRQRLLKMTESVRKLVEEATEVNAQETLMKWKLSDFSAFEHLLERLKAIR